MRPVEVSRRAGSKVRGASDSSGDTYWAVVVGLVLFFLGFVVPVAVVLKLGVASAAPIDTSPLPTPATRAPESLRGLEADMAQPALKSAAGSIKPASKASVKAGSSAATAATAASGLLGAFAYEVHGKVQGVFFRKHTQKKAQELKLVGWVMNTDHATVVGEAQGLASQLALFEKWLKNTGSPKSRIDRLDVSNRKQIASLSAASFEIRKGGSEG